MEDALKQSTDTVAAFIRIRMMVVVWSERVVPRGSPRGPQKEKVAEREEETMDVGISD